MIFLVFCDFVFAQDSTIYARSIPGEKVFNKPIVFPGANDTVVIICHKPVFRHSDKPLYVVDGILEDEADVKKLDPENIESISLLNTKDFAKIISCKPPKAVIIITTKTASQRTIIVKDISDGAVLPGASVEIISTGRAKNTLHLITDSFGRVQTNKIVPGKEYELRVSNVGYKTYTSSLNAAMPGKNYTVALERNYVAAAEVVIVSGTVCILRRVTYSSQKITACPNLKETPANAAGKIIAPSGFPEGLRIFPNSVQRSQNIYIEFKNKSDSKVTIRVFSLENKLVAEREYNVNEGMNRICHPIDARLAAGVYILQVVDRTNRFIRSGKIIVH